MNKENITPPTIFNSINDVMHFGANKYEVDGWKKVNIEKYIKSLDNHYKKVEKDILSVDSESGLLHLEHLAANVAIILEKIKGTL